MKFAFVVCCAALAAAEPEAKPKADADPYLLYGGYGLGYAGHYGYTGYPYTYGYYGKRSADAEPEADAALLYGGYGYGLGYRTYGYGYPYAYGAYGYYGKRSADAEPKADADPYSCTEDMALAMLDIMDMLDTHTPTDTTERDLLMLSQRLMLMLLSSMELTDMVLDTEPTDMDTHM